MSTIPSKSEHAFLKNVRAHYAYAFKERLYLTDELLVSCLVAYRAGKGPYETAVIARDYQKALTNEPVTP